jgi:phosphatidylethanolamine/phosphatidyl-N-methylethanolamine N-methyltransferase
MISHLKFAKEFLLNPRKTGAIAQSSNSLSNLIVNTSNIKNSRHIVELGPGRGSFTKKIMQDLPEESKFFALEVNDNFITETKKVCPKIIIYKDCATKINQYLKINNMPSCDTIISGLPWAAFNKDLQEKLIDGIKNSLSKDGEFLTFAYLQGALLPSGRRFKSLLDRNFKTVKKSKIVWNNLPPAFVYHCKN